MGAEPIPGGGCAAVFAATRLDPEPGAAAQISLRSRWEPLSNYADPTRLAQLQSQALGAANAELAPRQARRPVDRDACVALRRGQPQATIDWGSSGSTLTVIS